jgi:hypothetical protein
MKEHHVPTVQKSAGNNEEKRRHPRFIKRLPVKFFVDHECLNSLASDLSENGLFLRTNRGTNVNSVISIQLFLPSNRISYLKGIVRRTVRTPFSSMKNGMGIEIIEKDEEFAAFMKSICGGSIDEHPTFAFPERSRAFPDMPNEGLINTAIEEKRRHRRLNIELKGISGKMTYTNYLNVINISTGGISFEADRRLNMGKEYTLSIIYDKQVINVKGTVIWSIIRNCTKDDRGNVIPVYKAGMKFSDESREKIKEFIPLIEKSIINRRAPN